MKTEITLAICMYNAEKYIEETLACIMAQTMQDFHLLIVNDCSTDGSVECVKRFFKQNNIWDHTPRILLYTFCSAKKIRLLSIYFERNNNTKRINSNNMKKSLFVSSIHIN